MQVKDLASMKEWIIRLTLMSLGLIIGLLSLEFGLSKFALNPKTFHTGEFFERDKYIGWKAKPGEKGKDVFRIVVLGDSFTEALEVPLEKTFPYILEKRLNLGVGKRFEVINLVISGFGTAQEYLTLKYYGLKYHPDFVIRAFFMGNDVADNSLILVNLRGWITKKPFFILNNGKLEELPFKIKVSEPSKDNEQTKRDVTKQSKLKYLILKYLTKFFPNIYYSSIDRIEGTPWLGNFLWKVGIQKSKPELLDKSKKDEIPKRYYVYAGEYTEHTSEWQNAWDVTKALILKISKELEMNKIKFLVVVIPQELEFRPAIWNKTLVELNKFPEMKGLEFDVRKPERILSNFFETNNIDYLLLRPEFERYSRETGKDLHFHYAYENHWNTEGHALAAESIYEKLRGNKLVK